MWRGVKRTHNLRYRFHDCVRQEATARDGEEKIKKERSLPLRAGVARIADSALVTSFSLSLADSIDRFLSPG